MAILVKIIIVAMFIAILYALGSALFFLVSDKYDSGRVVKALTWRIGLSIVLFIFLMIAFGMGWIAPHALIL